MLAEASYRAIPSWSILDVLKKMCFLIFKSKEYGKCTEILTTGEFPSGLSKFSTAIIKSYCVIHITKMHLIVSRKLWTYFHWIFFTNETKLKKLNE